MKEGLRLALSSLLIAGALTGCEGSSAQQNSTPLSDKILLGCVESYPNATVSGIVEALGGDYNSEVTVGTRYKGSVAGAPPLQYNEGPKGLDGQPIYEEPITDEVCVYKSNQ